MPRPNNRLYDLLEVSPDASPLGIKQSWKRIASRLTAKAAYDEDAADRLEAVQYAYEVLGDREKRKMYHTYGEAGLEPDFQPPTTAGGAPGFSADPSEALPWSQQPGNQPQEAPWQGAPQPMGAPPPPQNYHPPPQQARPPQPQARRRRPAPEPAPPVEEMAPPPADQPDPKRIPETEVPSWRARQGHSGAMEIWVPFRRACLGGAGEVMVGDRIVSVQIPIGVEDGEEMEVDGVHFAVRVESDPVMWRDDKDVHQTLTIDRYAAADGCEATIRILDGYMKVTVPAEVTTGQKLRLKGKGIHFPGEEPGHMYLTIAVAGANTGRARVRNINLGTSD